MKIEEFGLVCCFSNGFGMNFTKELIKECLGLFGNFKTSSNWLESKVFMLYGSSTFRQNWVNLVLISVLIC